MRLPPAHRTPVPAHPTPVPAHHTPALVPTTPGTEPAASAHSRSRAPRDSYAVLVVDDHADNLFAMEQVLLPLGRRVLRATSGEQALRLVLRENIAVVLLDLLMPGLDGLDVLGYLRRLDQTRHLPVILITGVGRSDELAERAFRLGAAGFLIKPVSTWALRAQVEALATLYTRIQEHEAD
ncbi:two-component system response regulator [Streptomyces spectabilis]|uniref:Response regulator n=1 Tax=Streptomyces spectabilis TaxID=68270 RepID=A0A516R0U7_STRST|nr:response regulator [Streptomyces spectabilis]QDQ09281.1 response regulator [Streptomyces spectabilis]